MLTGSIPYNELSKNEVIQKVHAKGHMLLSRPERGPRELHIIMIQCFSLDAPKRPHFSDILRRLEAMTRTSSRGHAPPHTEAGPSAAPDAAG